MEAVKRSGLDVRQLRAFVALAELGRVTSAARALRLAQSTVSESLSSLERALGAEVMVRRRGRQRAQLTPAGHALLPHARTILAVVEDARLAVAGTTTTIRGRVDIVAAESVSSYVLPRALAELRARWPKMQFSVSTAPCGDVREGVINGAFDIGLLLEGVSVPVRAASLEQIAPPNGRVVVDAPLVVFAKPSHPLVRRALLGAIRRAELAAHSLFVSDASGDYRDLIDRFFKRDRDGGPVLEATGSVEGVKKAVAANKDALGLLPAYAVSEELRLGVIGHIDIHPAAPLMRVEALLSPVRARHPAIDDLLEGLRRVAWVQPGPQSVRPHSRL